MKSKKYISESEQEVFEQQNPGWSMTSWQCGCGESLAFINPDDESDPVVIVCDYCHHNEAFCDRWF